MSECTLNLAADFEALKAFVAANPGLMAWYVVAQVLSQFALSRSTKSSLNVVQRITLTIILSLLVYAGSSFMRGTV